MPVYINHIEIRHPVPLENRDIIDIGDASFIFINGQQYSQNQAFLMRISFRSTRREEIVYLNMG